MRRVVGGLVLAMFLAGTGWAQAPEPAKAERVREKTVCLDLLRKLERKMEGGVGFYVDAKTLECVRKYGDWRNILRENEAASPASTALSRAEPVSEEPSVPPAENRFTEDTESVVSSVPGREAASLNETSPSGESWVSPEGSPEVVQDPFQEILARLADLEERSVGTCEQAVEEIRRLRQEIAEMKRSSVSSGVSASVPVTGACVVTVHLKRGLLSENVKRILAGYGWRTPPGWWATDKDYEVEADSEIRGRDLYDVIQKILERRGLRAIFYLAGRSVRVVEAASK
ncbi:toxin co-regulated pilus biosynthesis Q family protein [Thermosulfurimonas sp. F29]|uniref:toxin co-regulated pilus biosynthesis Q family protein n=1 Tax=Thermosulfurimonas sp. F29 TaxID=2867247 RepID=UPI001C836BB9|nr:toxin co-regulated pilus biosynthesis Q family protein [Thermosulfurimonas sp. F29]MBX6423372.1 toxin co-regulated pilus biosynthesis Q family protein [Thermosulfurimonas sp. F29]